jgi:hypothetical protein
MTYRLYRLTRANGPLAEGMLLGSFNGFDEALAARDADTVELFSWTRAGQVLQAHHQILGPGSRGPATVHPVSTEIVRSPRGDPADITDAQAWLAAIHGRD